MRASLINLKEQLRNNKQPISVDVSCTVYNHGKYLRQALDGILMQETNFPVRIIIHDDASTDNSIDIIHEYQTRFPYLITAVIEEENLFQNGKSIWKKMLPYFTAKYIAVCEGDDFWIDKGKLQKQVDYLEKNQDCIALYHNILPVDKFGQYDESLRTCYTLLQEGDYSKKEIKSFRLKTQTASLMSRNCRVLMTDEDKDFYAGIGANGDNKSLLLYGILGRVHYFPDVMAAHRRVFDEGDSWTARQFRKGGTQEIFRK